MGDDRLVSSMAARERDRELLIPVGESHEDGDSKASASSASSSHNSGKEVSVLFPCYFPLFSLYPFHCASLFHGNYFFSIFSFSFGAFRGMVQAF